MEDRSRFNLPPSESHSSIRQVDVELTATHISITSHT